MAIFMWQGAIVTLAKWGVKCYTCEMFSMYTPLPSYYLSTIFPISNIIVPSHKNIEKVFPSGNVICTY